MNNKEKVLLGLTCFLGGVVAGFLIAPIKGGVCCGNNNGNNFGNNFGKEEENDTEEKDKDL